MTNFKEHFVGDCGNLFSFKTGLVRECYQKHFRTITNTRELKASLRAGDYTFPGGYQILYLCSDGGTLCPNCVRENLDNILDSIRRDIKDGWKITNLYLAEECDESQLCDHCNKEFGQ